MNWSTLEEEAKKLSGEIGFSPDGIVGISRGGLVPARLLAKYLDVDTIYCLNVRKSGEERKLVNGVREDVTGENLLLVEDMLETGRSLEVGREHLESKEAEVKTACLYVMPATEVEPDFCLKEVKEVKNFPWE